MGEQRDQDGRHTISTHCMRDSGRALAGVGTWSSKPPTMGLDYSVHFTDEETDVQRLSQPRKFSTTMIPHLSEEETKAHGGQVNKPKMTQPSTGGAPEAHAGGLMPEATTAQPYFPFLTHSKSQVASFQTCERLLPRPHWIFFRFFKRVDET